MPADIIGPGRVGAAVCGVKNNESGGSGKQCDQEYANPTFKA